MKKAKNKKDPYWSEEPKFPNWQKEDYENAGIKYIVPMTAKEIEDEETQLELLEDENYIVEEKLDGTRGIIHFFDDCVRCFSRRESKKSGWLTENTDSLPQIRDLAIPDLSGTVLDGEMYINGRPFKDVSSIMNCLPEEAIKRQKEIGWVTFHVFDILYYKGTCTEHMPLSKRKNYLRRAMKCLCAFLFHMYEKDYTDYLYIEEVPYYKKGDTINIELNIELVKKGKATYPYLYKLLNQIEQIDDLSEQDTVVVNTKSHKAYYEYIVCHGGEGVMVKPLDGRYYHKRGREYQKIKKFLTRDVIITDFKPPEKEYKGKFPTPDQWRYWSRIEDGELFDTECTNFLAEITNHTDLFEPVSKYYFEGWVGNIEYGVIITDEEIEKLPKNKKFDIKVVSVDSNLGGFRYAKVLVVGECSGFDEETREMLTKNRTSLIGSVIEVKANEIFKDTGKLRHPRFLRMRTDKSPSQCVWKDHIN